MAVDVLRSNQWHFNSSPPSAAYMLVKRTCIGSDNGFPPRQRQAII